MPKTVNPYWRKRLLIIAILLIAFIVWLCSCSPSKKLDAAEKRVLANIESVKRVRATTADLFPCANDSIVIRVHDTTINVLTKTLHHTDTITKNGVKYIYVLDTAYFEKTKIVYQDKIVTDHELTNRQKDTINSLRLREAAFSGTIAEVRTNLAIEHKSSNKKTVYIWLIIAGAIASHVLRSYFGGFISSIFKKN